MGSFIPVSVRINNLTRQIYTNVDSGSKTGAYVLDSTTLTSLATALGSGFSVSTIDMRGRMYPTVESTDANLSGNSLNAITVKTGGSAVNLPCLTWTAMPWLRMVFMSGSSAINESGISNLTVYFYDINSNIPNPLAQSYLEYYDRFWNMEVYTITDSIKILRSVAGTGFLMFHDGLLLGTGGRPDYRNNSGSDYYGWWSLDSSKVLYMVDSLYTQVPYTKETQTGNFITFEPVYNENHPTHKFTGIYGVIRGNIISTQVITRDGVSYLILGGSRSSGSFRRRQTFAVASTILG